jgi:hypothetical protein
VLGSDMRCRISYEKIFGAVDGLGDREGLTATEQHGVGMIEPGIRSGYDLPMTDCRSRSLEGGIVKDNGY